MYWETQAKESGKQGKESGTKVDVSTVDRLKYRHKCHKCHKCHNYATTMPLVPPYLHRRRHRMVVGHFGVLGRFHVLFQFLQRIV